MVTRLGFRLGIMPKGIALTASPDDTPDPFSFTDVTSAEIGTVTTSNAITVAGITASAAISISGGSGQYRINGGSWTSASGTVSDGDSVDVRVTSSGAPGTAVSTTLTIGGVSDTFSVTTLTGQLLLGSTGFSGLMHWMGLN